jgi:hypothetical protein
MNSRLQEQLDDVSVELGSLLLLRRGRVISKAVYDTKRKKLVAREERIRDRLSDLAAAAKKKAAAAAAIAKRTYVLTQEYYRETSVKDKKTHTYRQIVAPRATHTYTQTIVRRPHETMANLQKRAAKEGRRRVYDMDSDMYGWGADTIFKHHVGSTSLSQGGAGVGMSRVKPWAYEGADFYSIAEEGRCVPNSLVQLYPKRSYSYFVKKLFPGGDDSKPCLAEWIFNWAVKSDITVLGCDENYNILKGEETGISIEYFSKNCNASSLYFVQKDQHFYIMDRAKALSIVRSRANSMKVEKKEEEKVPMKKIFLKKDLIEIDFASYQNTHLVVRTVAFVRAYLIVYMNKTHSVPKMQFGIHGERSIYLKSFSFGTNKISFDPHFETVKKVSEKLKIPVDSVRAISDEYALQTIGVIPKSFMNNTVMDIFLKWKQRQHFAHIFKPESWKTIRGVEQTWDMNKQYTNILRNSQHRWLLLDMFSLPVPYSGVVGDAYYFIETENDMPCKGNGWYSRVIVEYLLEKGIDHKITYEIRAASTLVPNTFAPFVDKVMADVPDAFKYITNTFCGSLNIHEKKSASVTATTDKGTVLQKCLTTGASMCTFDVPDDTIYCAATIKKDLLFENNMPMYSQILDTAAVQLARGIAHLEKKGCIIRSYNTDSITFKSTTKLDIDLYTGILGGWKSEEPKPHEHEVRPKIDTQRFSCKEYSFKNDLKEGDVDVVDFLKKNSCFVSAPAGFGKSWIAEKVIEGVGADKCCVLGYTNIAANNIGGSTFHKTFKISLHDYKGAIPIKEIMKDKEILIIDEISQVPAKLYKVMEEVKKMGKRCLIFGDLKQILPVGESADGLMMLKILCENRITLSVYRRGDSELLDALTKVRERECISFPSGEKGSLHFCMTKQRRDIINERELLKVKSGYFDLVKNENLKRIFVGMPLRSIITKDDRSMLNGERWVIKSIEDDVSFESMIRPGVELSVPYDTVHKFFVPGFAMTIHSSQGLTIKEPYTVHIEERSAFDNDDKWRMIYTALSRACKKAQVGVVFHR